jgi:hypothetical protein
MAGKFDLAEIERLYRGTRISLKAIADQTGASIAYVRKLAEQRGWQRGGLADTVSDTAQERANSVTVIPPRPVPALMPDAQLVDEMSARGAEILAQQGAASGAGIAFAQELFQMAAQHLAAIRKDGVSEHRQGQAAQMALAAKASDLGKQAIEILAKAAPVQLRAAGLPERVVNAVEATAAAKAQAGVNVTINNGQTVRPEITAEYLQTLSEDELARLYAEEIARSGQAR